MTDPEELNDCNEVPTNYPITRVHCLSNGLPGKSRPRQDEKGMSRAGYRWFGALCRLRRTVLTVFGIMTVVPSVVSAHGGEPGASGGIISAPLLIVGAAAIGTVFGLAAILVDTDREWSGAHNSVGGLIGIILVVLGLLFARAAIHHSWLLAAICLLGGGFCGFVLYRQSVRCSLTVIDEGPVLVVTMGILGHRLFEGLTLGVSVLVDSSFGLIGAAVITGHATLETVGLGGYISSRDHLVAATAVVAVQAAFLLGAGLAMYTSLAAPLWLESAVSGVVGGVLLIFGIREITTHLIIDEANINA